MPKRVADPIDNGGFYEVKRLRPNSIQQDNKQQYADYLYDSDEESNSPAGATSNPAATPTLVQTGLPPAQLEELLEEIGGTKEAEILVSDIKSCKDEVFSKVLNIISHNIVKLTLFKVPKISELPSVLPNLREIVILADKTVTVPWLPNLLSQKKSALTTITLNSVNLENLEGAAIKLPALKTLKLVYCTGSLNTIISGCAGKLQSLEIRHAGNQLILAKTKPVTERDRAWAMYYGPPKKTYTPLGITGLKVPLVKLTQLTLHDCWDPSGVAFILKSCASTLQYLNLRNVDLTQMEDFNFPKVKTAVLELCKVHNDEMVFKSWWMLESLKIVYSTKLMLEGKNLNKMKNFKLEYAGTLTCGDYPDEDNYDDEVYDKFAKYVHKPVDGMIDFQELLDACSALEHLTLKGVNEDIGEDWQDDDDKDWTKDASTDNKKSKLKSITLKSCKVEPDFLKNLLMSSKSTLQTLNLQDMDMSMLRNINHIKLSKLKQVILRPRYSSLQVRERRANVNDGIVDLLKSCSSCLEELEVDAIIDVYDLKKVQATPLKKLNECRIKGEAGHQFSKVEESLIQTIFAA